MAIVYEFFNPATGTVESLPAGPGGGMPMLPPGATFRRRYDDATPTPPPGGGDPGFSIGPPTGGREDPGFSIKPPMGGWGGMLPPGPMDPGWIPELPITPTPMPTPTPRPQPRQPLPDPQPPMGGWGGMFPPPGDPGWRPGQPAPMPILPVPTPQPEQPVQLPVPDPTEPESPNKVITDEIPDTDQGLIEDQPPAGDVPVDTTPTDITTPVDPGASFVSAYTDVGDEAYSPYEQYQRRVLGQLPQIPYGTDAYKRLESAAMRRYAPTLGQFLLSAYPRAGAQAPTFTEWMQGTPGGPNLAAPGAGTPGYQTFQDIVGLSNLYDPTQTTGPLTEQQRVQMAASPFGGFLTGQPRAAITSYMLGGPQRGYLGQLMSGQAQRLQDLYGKERMRSGSEVFGAPEQGYFSWLSRQLPQGRFGAPVTMDVPVTPTEVVNPITNIAPVTPPATTFTDPFGGTYNQIPGGGMEYANPEDLARIQFQRITG